jgi:hypothetical protein
MIATLMGWGLTSRAAKLIAYVAIPLLVVLIIWMSINAYGNARFDAGEKAADAKWEEASRKLQEKNLKAQGVADEKAEARAEEYVARAADEKERIDNAVQNGTSPFDVLFPSN